MFNNFQLDFVVSFVPVDDFDRVTLADLEFRDPPGFTDS